MDESIHAALGFTVTALVFARRDIDPLVSEALRAVGLVPGQDEFKSGRYMASNPGMRELRERLVSVACDETKIAALVTPASARHQLGAHVLQALGLLVRRNGISLPLSGWFDRGLFRSAEAATVLARAVSPVGDCALAFEQDSRTVLGLQVADAVAHLVGQVLREEVTGRRKRVHIGGEGTGYPDGTMAPLGWDLLTRLRHSFFVRRVAPKGLEETVPRTVEPLLVPEDEDYVSAAQHPDILGWGVIVRGDVGPELVRAVEAVFGKLWLGCVH